LSARIPARRPAPPHGAAHRREVVVAGGQGLHAVAGAPREPTRREDPAFPRRRPATRARSPPPTAAGASPGRAAPAAASCIPVVVNPATCGRPVVISAVLVRRPRIEAERDRGSDDLLRVRGRAPVGGPRGPGAWPGGLTRQGRAHRGGGSGNGLARGGPG
jgi:hypothetical protein